MVLWVQVCTIKLKVRTSFYNQWCCLAFGSSMQQWISDAATKMILLYFKMLCLTIYFPDVFHNHEYLFCWSTCVLCFVIATMNAVLATCFSVPASWMSGGEWGERKMSCCFNSIKDKKPTISCIVQLLDNTDIRLPVRVSQDDGDNDLHIRPLHWWRVWLVRSWYTPQWHAHCPPCTFDTLVD